MELEKAKTCVRCDAAVRGNYCTNCGYPAVGGVEGFRAYAKLLKKSFVECCKETSKNPEQSKCVALAAWHIALHHPKRTEYLTGNLQGTTKSIQVLAEAKAEAMMVFRLLDNINRDYQSGELKPIYIAGEPAWLTLLTDGTPYPRNPIGEKCKDSVQVGKHSPNYSGKKKLQNAKSALTKKIPFAVSFFLGALIGIVFRLLFQGG